MRGAPCAQRRAAGLLAVEQAQRIAARGAARSPRTARCDARARTRPGSPDSAGRHVPSPSAFTCDLAPSRCRSRRASRAATASTSASAAGSSRPSTSAPICAELPLAALLRALAAEHRAEVVQLGDRLVRVQRVLDVGAHHRRGAFRAQRQRRAVAIGEARTSPSRRCRWSRRSSAGRARRARRSASGSPGNCIARRPRARVPRASPSAQIRRAERRETL